MSEHSQFQPVSGERGRARLAAARLGLFLVTSLLAASLVNARKPAPVAADQQPAFYSFAAPESIPAITEPKFVSREQADKTKMLEPDEPVIGVALGGEARAYSVWQLERHPVVNDRLGGRAIAVTWCPFSHTAIVYARSVGGKELTFEADGRLLRDTLVLRDRETKTSWTQADGAAIGAPGQLSTVAALLTTWKSWEAEQPSTLALDKGGEAITSSRYAAYEADPHAIGLGHTVLREPRFGAKTLIVGIVSGRDRVAIPLEELKRELVVMTTVDQQNMAAIFDPATQTARVVRAEARGQKVALRRGTLTDLYGRPMEPHLLDEETASRWDLTGRALSGRMKDQKLLLVPYRVQFWYAWQAFFPKSRVE